MFDGNSFGWFATNNIFRASWQLGDRGKNMFGFSADEKDIKQVKSSFEKVMRNINSDPADIELYALGMLLMFNSHDMKETIETKVQSAISIIETTLPKCNDLSGVMGARGHLYAQQMIDMFGAINRLYEIGRRNPSLNNKIEPIVSAITIFLSEFGQSADEVKALGATGKETWEDLGSHGKQKL
jgi:hypothetical protein